MNSILSGNYTLEVTKEFLSLNNNSDELILATTKDAIPQGRCTSTFKMRVVSKTQLPGGLCSLLVFLLLFPFLFWLALGLHAGLFHADVFCCNVTMVLCDKTGNSVYHGALVMSNALMYAGTTQHPFLTKNVEWLRRSQNWAKFSSVASLGVVHKGHTAHAMSVLEPYLPGKESSPYLNGGAFFALGLIYANHGNDSTIDYLIEQLNVKGGERETEVMNHGCCLGLGLAGMGTNREASLNHVFHRQTFASRTCLRALFGVHGYTRWRSWCNLPGFPTRWHIFGSYLC